MQMPVSRRTSEPALTTENESTRRFYEEQADVYDAVTSESDLTRLVDEFRGHVPGAARVLDLGCGPGRDARRLTQVGYRVVGLDYVSRFVKIAMTRSSARFIAADIRAVPFVRASFDAIWAVASLLHVPKTNIPAVLSALRFVVRPHGVLLASIKAGGGEVVNGDGRFYSLYSSDEWLALLQRSGWHTVHTVTMAERRQEVDVNWIVTVSTTDHLR